MSYDLHFLRRKDLTLDNIGGILEGEIVKTDPHFITKEIKNKIVESLKLQGLVFDTFENHEEAYIELNFPTYQVAMFNGQISISVPYWDINSEEGINKEVKQIVNTLLDNGFTGYDPQREEFITTKYKFKESFTESKTIIDKPHKEQTSSQLNFTYLGIGLVVVIIVIALWRMLK